MDDKSKKQVMVIGALVPVMLVFWIGALRSCGVFNRAPTASPASAAVPAASLPAPAFAAPEATTKTKDREAAMLKLEGSNWVRNPFRFGAVSTPTVVAPGRTVLPNMKLEGIVWDNKSPFAIIDGELRTVGDVIVGFTVQSIKKDRVILEKNGEFYELGLFPELK